MDHVIEALAPPGARLLLGAPATLVSLAARLWEPSAASDARTSDARALELSLAVRRGPASAPRPEALERAMRWSVSTSRVELAIEGFLGLAIDVPGRRAEGWVEGSLVEASPSLVARLLLEVPAGVLLSRDRHAVLHAGAVLGPRGAVVLRGASGAGKSTLVGAAHVAGLDVLGDESLLALRDDPDELSASVRELTLTPCSAALLGIDGEPTFSGGEEKRRVDLFARGTPAVRRSRRVATLLLGPRTPGPARLVPISAAELAAGFAAGSVPQETGDPHAIATAWGRTSAYRFEGFESLEDAVGILRSLVESDGSRTNPPT